MKGFISSNHFAAQDDRTSGPPPTYAKVFVARGYNKRYGSIIRQQNS